MAETSMFWEGNTILGGVGDAGPYGRDQFAAFWFAAQYGQRSGVLNGLAVTANSPAAASVVVTAGAAALRGYFYRLDAALTVDIAANTSGSPRIDRIVLRADWTAQMIRVVVRQGIPAGSPSAPSLTQIDGLVWEESLAQVAVASGFTTLAESTLTRERAWVRPDFPGKLEPLTMVTPPTGWLLCYGQAVSRTTYRDLFDAIGTQFGVGDGSTTFNLPDLRGRTIIGLDNLGGTSANVVTASAADTLGGTYGSESHTLTEAELPAHSHTQQYGSGQGSGSMSGVNGAASFTAVNTAGGIKTRTTGSGGAHNNMQPYMALPMMIRT